jgi:hypothetical protein
MKSGFFVGIAAVVACLFSASAAAAACDRYPTVAEEYAAADYVFVAQVTSGRMVRTPDDPEGFDAVEYTVQSLKTFKGEPPEELLLYSENSSGRFPMDVTGWYLVFVGPAYGFGFTEPYRIERAISNCGHSLALNTLPLALQNFPQDLSLDQILAVDPSVTDLVERADGCIHFAGEAPYDEDRRADIDEALTELRCDALTRDAAFERTRFEGAPEAQARLDTALDGWSAP